MRLAGVAALLGALVVTAGAGAAGLCRRATSCGGVRPRFDVGGTTSCQLTIVPGLNLHGRVKLRKQ
jgi:hypothetical protein